MAYVRGIVDRKPMVMLENGYWSEDESQAHNFAAAEAERKVRVIHTNNRFQDREDQIEAHVVESI